MRRGLPTWVLGTPASRRRNGGQRRRHRDGGAGSVIANSSGCATIAAMVQTKALPAQDGHLMSQGDEFEFQGEATTNPEREQRTEGGQKREHADDGMAAAQKTVCFLGLLEFCAGTSGTTGWSVRGPRRCRWRGTGCRCGRLACGPRSRDCAVSHSRRGESLEGRCFRAPRHGELRRSARACAKPPKDRFGPARRARQPPLSG